MQLAAERLLAKAGGLDQPGEIEAGTNAERLEQIDQILGADIASVTTAIFHLRGMAADAAERAIEMTHVRFKGRQRIAQTGSAGVVKMRDQGERANRSAGPPAGNG